MNNKLLYDYYQRKCNFVISECEEHNLEEMEMVNKLIEMLKFESIINKIL